MRDMWRIGQIAAVVILMAGAQGMAPLARSGQELPPPEGNVLLTVTGSIAKMNASNKAELDSQLIEAFGVTRLQTSTPWTEGRPVFEGVLMRDLLDGLGAEAKKVTVVALNDYKIDISTEDFDKYPVLLAMKMDGKPLRIRDKGPLWLIYPQDDFPELQNKPTQAKWVWQIKAMNFD
jgi:hypothetical protein